MKDIKKVEMNVCNRFWTRQNEMMEELEDLDYSVLEINHEYVVVADLQDEDKEEYILYLGHANSTMWIETIR